jgi:hypothetical protein
VVGRIALPDFSRSNEPHGMLAELPLPVYITTNYDNFMFEALEWKHKKPRRLVCRWNRPKMRETAEIYRDPKEESTPERPIVFHMHGWSQLPSSLVLTEDDYVDFLIKITEDKDLLPKRISQAFSESSLLFLGYRLEDPDFRLLFRKLVHSMGRSGIRTHVSVQFEDFGSDADRQSAREYLNKYFGASNVQVYWGTCEQFTAELRHRWRADVQKRAAEGPGLKA